MKRNSTVRRRNNGTTTHDIDAFCIRLQFNAFWSEVEITFELSKKEEINHGGIYLFWWLFIVKNKNFLIIV